MIITWTVHFIPLKAIKIITELENMIKSHEPETSIDILPSKTT